ncbi:MAG TPA: DUF5655 domain-containing protein [Acidobacteriota bacterium]|jgi:hypothetical protein
MPKLWKIGIEMQRWCALLEEELLKWPHVKTKPMFGMVAFYRGKNIFAAVPRTRAAGTETSVLFKLPRARDDRLRIAGRPGAGWVAFEIGSASDINEALQWLERAYEKAKPR